MNQSSAAQKQASTACPRRLTLASHYSNPAARRRIRSRMAALKISRLEDYLQYLAGNPDEANVLGQAIRVSLTSFFRDVRSFETLKCEVFPKLLERKQIRVWVVGCSTGEEAYSVAISLAECLEGHADSPHVQIFATDIDNDKIQKARCGLYPEHITADVCSERVQHFFLEDEDGYRIVKSIRDLCIFAKHDLLRDPPFSKLDMICCRNVLTYLNAAAQGHAVRILHYALRPEGYLWLGRREEVDAVSTLFFAVDRQSKIYRRNPMAVKLPLTLPLARTGAGKSEASRVTSPLLHSGDDLQGEASRILFEHYAPGAVIIDSDFQVQHFLGQTGMYLEPARGRASLDLLRMVRDSLARDLPPMVQRARDARSSVRREGCKIESNGDSKWVNLEVVPLDRKKEDGGYFMVIFEPVRNQQANAPLPMGNSELKRSTDRRAREDCKLRQLRQELDKTQKSLQAAIKEQAREKEGRRAANEAILSASEDLQSINEQLVTAKEEVQSANEELTVLNEELRSRVAELTAASDDLENLLRTAGIILFLDEALRVRRFTSAAGKLFGIMPTSAGQRVGELRHRLELPNLQDMITETLETATPCEAEVRDKEGHWYSLRIRPYKANHCCAAGAVLLLTDIDALKSRLTHEEHDVGERQCFSPPEVCGRMDETLRGQRVPAPDGDSYIPRLTHRQQDVIRLLAGGKSNKEVAAALGIGTRTAEAHRGHIMAKLGLKTFSELVRYAVREHIVEP